MASISESSEEIMERSVDGQTKLPTEEIAARAYNQFSQICSDKIDRRSWGKTVLTLDWAAGRITRVEVQDTTTTKPTPPANGG
jgi:hypothetical protein